MIAEELLEDWRQRALRVEEEVRKAIVGQQDTARLVNVFSSRVGPPQVSDSLIQEQKKEPILTLRDAFSGQKSTL